MKKKQLPGMVLVSASAAATPRAAAASARGPVSAHIKPLPKKSAAKPKPAPLPSKSPPVASAPAAMTTTMAHESPDGEGLFLPRPAACRPAQQAPPPSVSPSDRPAGVNTARREQPKTARGKAVQRRPRGKEHPPPLRCGAVEQSEANANEELSCDVPECITPPPQQQQQQQKQKQEQKQQQRQPLSASGGKAQKHAGTFAVAGSSRSQSGAANAMGPPVARNEKSPNVGSGEQKEKEMHTMEDGEPVLLLSPLPAEPLPVVDPHAYCMSPTPPATALHDVSKSVMKTNTNKNKNTNPLSSSSLKRSASCALNSTLSMLVPSLAQGYENFQETIPGAHTSLEEALESLRSTSMLFATRQVLTRSLASPEEKDRTATIVFDLDETLCNNRGPGPAILRPGAAETLRKLRALYPRPTFARRDPPAVAGADVGRSATPMPSERTPGGVLCLEIIIWTASVEAVARPVISSLDPDGNIIDDVIYRDVRWYRQTGYTKDLRRMGRHMNHVIIVENAPACIYLNRRNAILVTDFVSNRVDRQLFIVRAILQEWLENMSALVYNRCLSRIEQKRLRLIEDGGESPQPEESVSTAATTDVAAPQGSPLSSNSHGNQTSHSRGTINTIVRGPTPLAMQALEHRASAIWFLSHHPFLSPATRYVRPSRWKDAMRLLNGVANIGTAKSREVQKGRHATLPPVGMQSKCGGAGNTPRSAQARTRGHRLIADITRGLRETLMK